jgi:hypothetical protein
VARMTPPDAHTDAHAAPTVTFDVHFRSGTRGRKRMRTGAVAKPKPVEPGHIPRISRLMALAIHFDRLIRKGAVRDYGDIARLGSVSKSRVSQIMALLDLAPSIQEAILFMPRTSGRDVVTERSLRGIVAEVDWDAQSKIWESRCRT